jgi:hypothetical protein
MIMHYSYQMAHGSDSTWLAEDKKLLATGEGGN